MKSSYIVFAALISMLGLSNAQAQQSQPHTNSLRSKIGSFAPENHWDVFDTYSNSNQNPGSNPPPNPNPNAVNEATFNKIADAVVALWQPLAQLHGATLSVEKRWTDSTVNAYATQSGNNWQVHMFGGLARRPEITPDGFALVVCHELGHHFGGFSFINSSEWASNEGQADYFATDVCAKHVFAQFFDRRFLTMTDVPAVVKQRCDAAWNNAPAQSLCYRSAAGGLALANLLAKLGSETQPHFETPDKTVVTSTDPEHPQAQCRLDTYLAGAVCNADFDPKVIPGRGTNQMSAQAEAVAGQYSCMDHTKYQQGFRPLCWFKPMTNSFQTRR